MNWEALATQGRAKLNSWLDDVGAWAKSIGQGDWDALFKQSSGDVDFARKVANMMFAQVGKGSAARMFGDNFEKMLGNAAQDGRMQQMIHSLSTNGNWEGGPSETGPGTGLAEYLATFLRPNENASFAGFRWSPEEASHYWNILENRIGSVFGADTDDPTNPADKILAGLPDEALANMHMYAFEREMGPWASQQLLPQLANDYETWQIDPRTNLTTNWWDFYNQSRNIYEA